MKSLIRRLFNTLCCYVGRHDYEPNRVEYNWVEMFCLDCGNKHVTDVRFQRRRRLDLPVGRYGNADEVYAMPRSN